MRNYVEAQKVLATARDRECGKPLGGNTRLFDLGSCLAVCLHHTYVVTYYPNGSVVLNSNRWRTKTTKERINDYLPDGWSVKQEKGVWYLIKEHATPGLVELREYIFEDGIRIGPRGGCDGKLRPKKKERKKESKPHPIGGWNPIEL